jgi:hypothetical protein
VETVLAKFKELAELSKRKHEIMDDHLAREKYIETTRLMVSGHVDLYGKQMAFIATKEAYLKAREHVHSVGEAETQIALLDRCDKEMATAMETTVAELQKLAQEILDRKYVSISSYIFENTTYPEPTFEDNKPEERTAVTTRVETVLAKFKELAELSKRKHEIMDDHLAREKYIVISRRMGEEHGDKFGKLMVWIAAKEAYLKAREHVHSVVEAQSELHLLDLYEAENKITLEGKVAALKKLGEEILARKYETALSNYSYEATHYTEPTFVENKPEVRASIGEHERTIASKWDELALLCKEKREVLLDHLARETYADETRRAAKEHEDRYRKMMAYIATKEAYVRDREVIHSIGDATAHLEILDASDRDLASVVAGDVAALLKFGAALFARKYETALSSYSFEKTHYAEPVFDEHKPEQRAAAEAHEAEVTKKCDELKELSVAKRAVLDDHLKREHFTLDTRMQGQRHQDVFDKTLTPWLDQKAAYLRHKEEIRGVNEAKQALVLLEQYRADAAAMEKSTVTSFYALGKAILALEYSSKYGTFVYDHTQYSEPQYDLDTPEKKAGLQQREETLCARWKELAELAAEKERVLQDDLAREMFAADVRLRDQQHKTLFTKISAFVSAKAAYLKERPLIESVSDAKKQIALGEAFDKEKAVTTETAVAALGAQATEILGLKYESKYSSFVPENPDEIRERLDETKKGWAMLDELRAVQKKDLEAALELEQEKERLRLEYAHLVAEFNRYAKDTANNLAIEAFGFTLEEVEAYKATIDGSVKLHSETAEAKQTEIKRVDAEMKKIGVKENVYCRLTLDDVAKERAAMDKAIDARNARYDTELARQRFNDGLCRKFAEAAEPLCKWVIEKKDAIGASKETLEEQLAFVEKQVAALAVEVKRLEAVQAVAVEMEKAGITQIRHTTLTARDVEVTWEQFKKFLATKREMLQGEIESSKLRGVTPEQFKEIEESFKRYDTDKSGDIDRKELTVCLYSLGEEKTSKEIAAIMAQFGDAKTARISYSGFKDFMVHLLGDTDTKDEIVQSLVLINRGKEHGDKALMTLVMPKDDVAYIEQTAPKTAQGLDYKAWVEAIFSR